MYFQTIEILKSRGGSQLWNSEGMGGNAFWNFWRLGGFKTWKLSMVGYGYFLELPISMGHNGSPRLACPIKEHWRYSLFWLQVDPLSLCPSCANGNRKENLKTWRWEAHERRDYRLSPIDWIMYCFHNAKYDWLMLGALTACHHSRYVRCNACRNVKKI